MCNDIDLPLIKSLPVIKCVHINPRQRPAGKYLFCRFEGFFYSLTYGWRKVATNYHLSSFKLLYVGNHSCTQPTSVPLVCESMWIEIKMNKKALMMNRKNYIPMPESTAQRRFFTRYSLELGMLHGKLNNANENCDFIVGWGGRERKFEAFHSRFTSRLLLPSSRTLFVASWHVTCSFKFKLNGISQSLSISAN